jgi:hypothetical protein
LQRAPRLLRHRQYLLVNIIDLTWHEIVPSTTTKSTKSNHEMAASIDLILRAPYTYTAAASASAILVASVIMFGFLKKNKEASPPPPAHPLAGVPLDQLPQHIQQLVAELQPNSVVLQSDAGAFAKALEWYFALPNREIIPACIVQLRSTSELSKAVRILGAEYERRRKAGGDAGTSTELFAVRSGGANTGVGSSTLANGVVLDLSLFKEIEPAEDGQSVRLGAGVKWLDAYDKLEKERGIAVLGARNTPPGVGGLALQGLFSPILFRSLLFAALRVAP